MYITASFIDKLNNTADLLEVVKRFMPDLKQKGVNYMGCCPFHNEKSGSFSVNPVKGVYKCFGCGKGGSSPINFVMDKERKPFAEAVEYLAGIYNLVVEYEAEFDAQALQKKKDEDKERFEVLTWAEEWYFNKLQETPRDSDPWKEIFKRGYTEETAIKWRLGFAPAHNRNIVEQIINKGWFTPAEKLGLVKSKSGYNYDSYQHRIMVPIKNNYGACCGFGGRYLGKDDFPKWVNPPENDAYDKKNLLYGLSEARPFIRANGCCYVVEGYFDVISMHEAGICNTVATSGTSVPPEQVRLLKREFSATPYVIIAADGDDAGIAAAYKQIDLFQSHGFRTDVIPFPDEKDPEEFIRQFLLTPNKTNDELTAAA